MRTLIIHLLLCLLTSSIFAQQKIAVVDYDSVLMEHPLYAYGTELEDSLNQIFYNTLMTKQTQMENFYISLMSEHGSGSCFYPTHRQKELEDSLTRFQNELLQMTSLIDSISINFMHAIINIQKKNINNLIVEISIEQQLTYCIKKSSILFANENITDITDLAIQTCKEQDHSSTQQVMQTVYNDALQDFMNFEYSPNYKH